MSLVKRLPSCTGDDCDDGGGGPRALPRWGPVTLRDAHTHTHPSNMASLLELEKQLSAKDGVMEPNVGEVLRAYVAAGGNPKTAVDLLSDNFRGASSPVVACAAGLSPGRGLLWAPHKGAAAGVDKHQERPSDACLPAALSVFVFGAPVRVRRVCTHGEPRVRLAQRHRHVRGGRLRRAGGGRPGG